MLYYNGEGFSANFQNPLMWVEFGLSFIVIFFLNFVVFRSLRRGSVKLFTVLVSLGLIAAFVFSLTYLWVLLVGAMIVALVIFYSINAGVIRPYVTNTLTSKTDEKLSFIFGRNKKGLNNDKIFDRASVYDKVEAAVLQLSSSKTGGLITFEKETELTDYAKSGTILNAPVTPELLVTIFYPGTRLHDGAVIIRRDKIYAAAVYYDPITSGLTGKYGSRHRAALGISKATDSVTIVISEETGRISLAVAGELIHVSPDDFRRTFEDYMLSKAEEEK